jgi:hypothetical protein
MYYIEILDVYNSLKSIFDLMIATTEPFYLQMKDVSVFQILIKHFPGLTTFYCSFAVLLSIVYDHFDCAIIVFTYFAALYYKGSFVRFGPF